jgi:phthalate 4,5-cis-dihydrodiol dehydrogenase
MPRSTVEIATLQTKSADMRTLKVGVLGLGQGAANVMPTMDSLEGVQLAAGADVNPRMREAFRERYPDRAVYESAEAVCADPDLDAIWVSTPNKFHAEGALEAMRNGKHVAVEKPMAVTIEDADRMVDASEKYGVALVAAHTSSYGLPIRAMRRLAMSDELQGFRHVLMWSFMDWMLRARTPEELSLEAGAGIVHRQGPHQVDVLRLLGGGKLRRVSGTTGEWMPERAIPGFFTGHFAFENGTSATTVLNGYGYFMAGELFEGAPINWRYNDEDRLRIRRELGAGTRNEQTEKEAFRIGGAFDPTQRTSDTDRAAWFPTDLGMTVVSCTRGVLRHAKHGVYVYSDNGKREIDLRSMAHKARDLEGGATIGALTELRAAAFDGVPPYHSGAWGRATLEATLGLIQSSQEQREVTLHRQVELRADYDAELLDVVEPVA